MGERIRILYIDCGAGVSGDMLLGALVDAGLSIRALRAELAKLGVDGFRLARKTAVRGGVSGTRLRVATTGDRGYRHFADFERAIGRSKLSEKVKDKSLGLLRRIFEAEAEVHGTTFEKIHLHELGSLDTLVDVVGAIAGVELLEVSEIVSSPVNVGSGYVDTEHGRMPVPAPATALLLKGAPVFSEEDGFERTTPTGALLATGLSDRFGSWPEMTLLGLGYGLGDKDPRTGRPNALRVALGERPRKRSGERILVAEATVDDMTPEQVGYLHERLWDAGALDVFVTAVQMKKNRPGANVTVLLPQAARGDVSRTLFSEGTTLGVRFHEVEREVLERRSVTIETRFGKVRVKEGLLGGKVVNRAPEFEDVKRIAAARKLPLKEVQLAALAAPRRTEDER